MGHIITSKGVKADEEKVKAIQNTTPPTNVK